MNSLLHSIYVLFILFTWNNTNNALKFGIGTPPYEKQLTKTNSYTKSQWYTGTTQVRSASEQWCCLALLWPASRKFSGLGLITSWITIKSSSPEWNSNAWNCCSFPNTVRYLYSLRISAHKELSTLCYRGLWPPWGHAGDSTLPPPKE